MKVQIVDPPAYTPPYDRSLSAALAAAGAEVELVTSEFAHGPVPPAEGYEVSTEFYRRSSTASERLRRPLRAAEHLADMWRFRRRSPAPDVSHFQWLTVPGLDARLLPRGRALVQTPHGLLRASAWEGRTGGYRRLLGRMDALVALSEYFAPLPAPKVAVYAVFAAGAIALALTLLVGDIDGILVPLREPAAWTWILAGGIAGAAIPTTAFIAGIGLIGPSRAAIMMTIEPLVGVALAAALLGEHPSVLQLIGGAVVLIAAAILQVAPRRKVAAEPEFGPLV